MATGEGVRPNRPYGSFQTLYSSRLRPARHLWPGLRVSWFAALAAQAVSGCSISMPIPSLMSHPDEDVTNSISRPFLAESLGGEDARRAKAAMTTALDPQGAGSTVAWNNPDSGAKGTFVPIGNAYPENERVCRSFLAEIDLKTGDKSLQGTACADKDGNWTVTDAKPWKKT